jgi:hypothetical protein
MGNIVRGKHVDWRQDDACPGGVAQVKDADLCAAGPLQLLMPVKHYFSSGMEGSCCVAAVSL